MVSVEIDVSVADVIEAAGEGKILEEIGIKTVLRYFDPDDVLDEIGREKAINHFDIEVA